MPESITIRPTAQFGLTRGQFDFMHRTAVELAAKVGFQVSEAALRDSMTGREGLRVEGNRIYPSEAAIDAYTAEMRARHDDPPTPPDEPPILYVTDRPLYMVDDDQTHLRPFTTQDVIDGAKLTAMLYDRGVRGGAVGLPADVPPALAPFEQVRIALRYGRCGGYSSHGFTLWHTRYLAQIARVQGGGFGLSVWMPSPFRLEGNELEVVLAMEGQFDSLGVGSMPLMGITAPMNQVQNWIQVLAETLGAATILQARFPEVPVDIFPHPKPADLATGGYAMGTPEMHLFDALKSELLPCYGLRPPWGKSAVLGAAVPGPQAMLERSAAYLLGCLHGYRAFDMAGAMSHGDVFSPVQLLLDVEAVSWAERYARGLAWSPTPEDMARWVQIATGGGLFADDPEEVARMRTTYRLPHFFPSVTASQRIAEQRDAIAEAKAEIPRLIAAHHIEPDANLLRDVDAIIERARLDLPA
jgi:hypothetical protein